MALEALESVEAVLNDCVEAYVEEKYGIRYAKSVVVVELQLKTGTSRQTVRVMNIQYESCTESDGDILSIDAWVHALGQDTHNERSTFLFNSKRGDSLLVIG